MASVKFDDLELAFEYASVGGQGETEAWLRRDSGVIFYHSEFGDNEEELPDDIDSDRYIAIPGKNDLDLGRRLALRFTADVLPEMMPKIQAVFGSRGAYARFKDILEARGQLDQWYAYEASAKTKALREWCEDNGIEVEG